MATLEELRKIYDECDSDKNGLLNFEEAQKALQALGKFAKPVQGDFKSEFEKMANAGSINFEEFKLLSTQKYG